MKIGYADNMENRLKQLNRSECIPFAFRVYAIKDGLTTLAAVKKSGRYTEEEIAAIAAP